MAREIANQAEKRCKREPAGQYDNFTMVMPETEGCFETLSIGLRVWHMERVVFLDIDGVLNSNFRNESHQSEISDGTLIDESKIKLLCKLIRNTNAEIILHSGWKYWFDEDLNPLRKEAENLKMLLQKEGLTIAGVTPDHATEEIRKSKRFSLVKAGEILAWLEQHEEVAGWVVLDDLDLHNAEIERHQVKTDQRIGLTIADVEKAEEIVCYLPEKRRKDF